MTPNDADRSSSLGRGWSCPPYPRPNPNPNPNPLRGDDMSDHDSTDGITATIQRRDPVSCLVPADVDADVYYAGVYVGGASVTPDRWIPDGWRAAGHYWADEDLEDWLRGIDGYTADDVVDAIAAVIAIDDAEIEARLVHACGHTYGPDDVGVTP